MISFEVNYLAILLSSIAAMIIGYLWYSPLVFGKRWLAIVGLKAEDPQAKAQMNKAAMKAMGIGFLLSILIAFVLANILAWSGASTVSEYLAVAFYVWLGFIGSVILMNVMYQQKPVILFLIDGGYQLVMIMAMALIIGLWQ